jgi:RimJ/RimL family protein N-acetyltransferase
MDLQTDRLLLKPADKDDADFVLQIYNTPKFLKFIGDRKLRTKTDAENYIAEKMLPQMEKLGFGNYVIINKETGAKMGSVGIFARETVEVMDIGFSFLPEFFGFGYAFEASEFLINHVKQNFGLQKISAITMEENTASRKLIEKLGLKIIKKIILPNDTEELMYYEKNLD